MTPLFLATLHPTTDATAISQHPYSRQMDGGDLLDLLSLWDSRLFRAIYWALGVLLVVGLYRGGHLTGLNLIAGIGILAIWLILEIVLAMVAYKNGERGRQFWLD